MSERQEQKRTLLALSRTFAPLGLFWTCDVGTGVPFSSIRAFLNRIKEVFEKKGLLGVLDAIRRLPVISYGIEGGPDIQGTLLGRWVGIEMKIKGGRQRPSQKAFQAAIEKAGGIYILAYSEAEAIEKLWAAIAPTAHERLALTARIAAARPGR
jgi:hypothetical protein